MLHGGLAIARFLLTFVRRAARYSAIRAHPSVVALETERLLAAGILNKQTYDRKVLCVNISDIYERYDST